MDALFTLSPADFTAPVVTLALAKKSANIHYDDQDDLLTLFLQAAIEDAENYTGTIVQERDATIRLAAFQEYVDLPVRPLTSVSSVVYKDANGQDQALVANDDFEVVQEGYALHFTAAEFPELQDVAHPITVTGKVGFTAATVPNTIKRAILLKFGYMEMYREDAPKEGTNRSFNAALRPFKVF